MYEQNRTKTALIFAVVAIAGLVFSANAAHAATVTVGSTAPIADADDEANLAAPTGLLKWFSDIEHDAGQTFTPSADLTLNAFTIQLGRPNEDDGPDWLNFRIGTITRPEGVFTFTDLPTYTVETAYLGTDQFAGDYMTFTLDVPQALTGGVEYGVILDAQNMGNWHIGIPYLNTTGNTYTGGAMINRGGSSGKNDLLFLADLSASGTPGDANGDDVLDAADYIMIKRNFGQAVGTAGADGDLDGDGIVNWGDLQMLQDAFNSAGSGAEQIPEPATLFIMLAAGVPALLKRRRSRS